MPDSLLDNSELETSPVVANSAMNRERNLSGANSYAKDLGLNPFEFLWKRLETEPEVAWLDFCCGAGRALRDAATAARLAGIARRIRLVGMDLVDCFDPRSLEWQGVTLETASVTQWTTEQRFDLITCVHGLHYVGDKLGAIRNAVSWLKPDGLFIAHLDFANIRLDDGRPAVRAFMRDLRDNGFVINPGRHSISRQGGGVVSLNYRYIGADDKAGPNFSGQPAVNSYYARL